MGVVCKIRSLGLHGVNGYEVTAECDLSGGLPNFEKVGHRINTRNCNQKKTFSIQLTP